MDRYYFSRGYACENGMINYDKYLHKSPSPRRAYSSHKGSAKQRGIMFLLSFDDWWAIWEPHFHKRGCGRGKMCMARKLDRGAYTVGNVDIIPFEENLLDAYARR